MRHEALLGLPLAEALARLDPAEPVPEIVYTAPGGTHRDPDAGTPRLIRVREGAGGAPPQWVCARFLDGDPQGA